MLNNKMISVIVPIYNTDSFLNRCIDSILAQTYTNLQIILVDDGSTDTSPQICDEYAKQDSRVIVIHKKNGGLSSARNAGLDVATGEYIGFVDSDDYIAPDMYINLIKHIGENFYDIANVMYVRVDENNITYPSIVIHTTNEIFTVEQYAKELMLHTGDVSVCTKLFHKSIINDIRFVEGKLNEDLLFILELLPRINSIHFVGEIGYYYFIRNNSISSGYGKAVIDMVGNSEISMNRVKEHFPNLSEEAERFALYQHMAYLLLVPDELANEENEVYINAIKFIKEYTLKNIFNKYLTLKNKVVLLGLIIAPNFTSKCFKTKKHR